MHLFVQHYSTALVSLVSLYANYPEVVSLVLGLAVSYAERVLPLLSDTQALQVFFTCAELMHVYSAHHLGVEWSYFKGL